MSDSLISLSFTQIEFLDTSYLVPGHPGIKVIPSASSSKVYKIGNGDDSPDWNIDSISLVKVQAASLLDRINVRRFSYSESVDKFNNDTFS